jgi:putative transcriptional regulator
MEKLALNRLRIILAEKNKKNKWLADQLKVNVNTVSSWLNNTHQPSLQTLYKIAILLDVNIHDLIAPTKAGSR